MKENKISVGIDVSKEMLDVCVFCDGNAELMRVKNKPRSVKALFTKLQKRYSNQKLIVCMENTGYYNWPCYDAFNGLDIDLYVVNPLHLKKSLGLVRGKTDAIDAERIAKFISLHHTEMKSTLIPRKKLRELQALIAQRVRLVSIKTKLNVPADELSLISGDEFSKVLKASSKKVVVQIEKQILEIEGYINELIKTDDDMKRQYNLMTSVPGVGKVLAWNMLVKTNEFKSINNPRKLACYCGVVPFEFSSGSSIYKKPRVSFMADKTLKKLLHLSALRTIQLKGELSNYYQRKVSEGKNKMSVINAIRNKIVSRICSSINNQRMYEPNLVLS